MSRFRFSLCFICPIVGGAITLLYLLLFASPSTAQENKQGGKTISFIQDVAPILKQNCLGCHDAKKKKGKLDMTSFETFRKGGRNDDPVIPGKPKASYLVEVLIATDSSRMPPKEAGSPLSKEKIDLISAWIEQGAKLDLGIDPKSDLLRELRARWQPPALLSSYSRPALINAVTFSPDNKKLITSGYHEIIVWDIPSAKVEKRIHTRAERAHDLEFLPDGLLAVAGGRPGQEGDVRIYNLNAKGKSDKGVMILDGVNDPSVLVAQLVQTEDEVLSLDLSDDGKKLAATGCDRLVRVWDISQGIAKAKLEETIENHADWVLSVQFSPNGKFLITASRDKSAKVWDLKAKESLVTFQGHNEIVWGAVFSSDNKHGISVGTDKNLRTWDAEEKSKQLGKQIKAGGGHSKDILKLVDNRKGKDQILATCGADGTVRLWNAKTGQSTRTLTGFKDHLFALALSPNGEMVAAGGYSGEIRIWKISDGSLVKNFNASPGYQPATVSAKGK